MQDGDKDVEKTGEEHQGTHCWFVVFWVVQDLAGGVHEDEHAEDANRTGDLHAKETDIQKHI